MRSLLLLVLSQCLWQAFAGGGGGRWWCDDVECFHEDYAYVEAVIVVTLVILAVLFDTAHHKLEHVADHSYFYGKLQSVAPLSDGGCQLPGPPLRLMKQRTPLLRHWVNRLSQEFMVLGFLAFFVFVFRETGGFEWVVQTFPPANHDVHLPKTAEDWLHMVENVHMKLFLGMLIYFLLILRVVKGCVKHVEFWEEMRILRRSSKPEDSDFSNSSSAMDHTRLRRYGRWRLYFIQSVMSWRETRPKLYEETLKRLAIWSGDTPSQRQLHRTLDDVFPFSAYLAYSVRSCCKDAVDIHRITWAAVIVLFSVFAVIHRYTKLILLHFMPVFIVGAFVLLFCVGRLVRMFRERVESEGVHAVQFAAAAEDTKRKCFNAEDGDIACGDIESGESSTDASKPHEGFHERHATELWVFRMLQIFLFVLAYSCARTVGDPNDWRNRPTEVLAVSSAFMVLFLVLGSLLPKYVPNFAALMAMPPYCDQKNVDTFFEVLDEYNKQHGGWQENQDIKLNGSVCLKDRGQLQSACCVTEEPKSVSADNQADCKMACERFEIGMAIMTRQHNQLAAQIQDISTSRSLGLPQFLVMDGQESESAAQRFSLTPLSSETGMMRAQLARLEGLMQSQALHHPVPHVTFTSVEPSGYLDGTLPHDGDCKCLRTLRTTRDLPLFTDPLTSHTLTHLDHQDHHAGPTRGADEVSGTECMLGGVVN